MAEPLDTPTLTINSRLARHLLFLDSKQQKESGNQVWETPQIYEFRAWFKTKLVESWSEYFILTDLQSIKIWESIINDSLECKSSKFNSGFINTRSLLNLHAVAEQAAEAYKLIKEYKISIDTDQSALTRETTLFIGWMKKYEVILKNNKAIDSSNVINNVCEYMKEGRIPIPNIIKLCGFDEITPQIEDCLDFLRARKTSIKLLPDPKNTPIPTTKKITKNKNIRIYEFTDRREEVINCARWVRSIHKKDQFIAIVIPELEHYRQKIHKELSSNLAPISIFPWEKTELPFNISLGTPVANESMVQVALDIISVPEQGVPPLYFLKLIRSENKIGGSIFLICAMHLGSVLKGMKIQVFFNLPWM